MHWIQKKTRTAKEREGGLITSFSLMEEKKRDEERKR
jgi:hypothetical protein